MSLVAAISCTAVLMIPVLIFAEPLVSFFNSNEKIIEYGAKFLRLVSPFYVCCCVNQILAGSLRGAGDSKAPMYIMVGCYVVFRQIYLFFMTNYIANTETAVALGYPAAWLLCSLLCYIYFSKTNWEKHRLVDKKD